MVTTILGTCDACDRPDREIARCIVHDIETFACDECRGGGRPIEDNPTCEAMTDLRVWQFERRARA